MNLQVEVQSLGFTAFAVVMPGELRVGPGSHANRAVVRRYKSILPAFGVQNP